MFKRITKVAAIAYIALALSPLVAVALHYVFVEAPRLLSEESAWPHGRDTVTAPERANDLAKKGLMEQLVTFGEGMTGLRKDPRTDTYDLYAIGVGQTTLPGERSSMMGLTGGGPPTRPDLRYASSSPITGAFNNILLFNPKSGEIVPVFSTRLGISSFKYIAGPDFETLVVFATEKDTDKDGRLTNVDIQSAYVYAIEDRTLHAVSGLSGNPVDVEAAAGQAYAIVRATQDDNRDGRADPYAYGEGVPEPDLLFRLDLRTYQATPLVPKDMLQTLQRTLEARPPIKPQQP